MSRRVLYGVFLTLQCVMSFVDHKVVWRMQELFKM